MKKIITLSAAAIMAISMFASCKKDYTCTCNINGTPTDFNMPNTRKPDAKIACEALQVGTATDCKLK